MYGVVVLSKAAVRGFLSGTLAVYRNYYTLGVKSATIER